MRRIKLPQLPNINPEPLSEDEIQRVLKASLYETDEKLRNFAILMLFLDTGIRLDELVNLKLSKIDFALGEMTVFGKGRKERKEPIGTQAIRALMDYVTMQRPNPINPQYEDQVFLNADGYPITHDAVEKVFQQVKKAAGVPIFHPHACRHTFSVSYLMNGGDAFSLQKILGHTTLEMTRRYVNLASGDVKEKHRRFSPLDNLGFRVNGRGRSKMTKAEVNRSFITLFKPPCRMHPFLIASLSYVVWASQQSTTMQVMFLDSRLMNCCMCGVTSRNRSVLGIRFLVPGISTRHGVRTWG